MQLNLQDVGTIIQSFFHKQMIEKRARLTKFVQRHSRLNGQTFLQASVFGFIEDPQANLDDLAQACGDLGIEISAQGFDQRINEQALEFLKEMLSEAISMFKNKIALPLPILHQFTAINLVDSTVLSLPDNMVNDYPGCGGDGPDASLKIQLNFEFLYGNLEQIVAQPGKEPDQKYRAYLDWIQPGSLNINDLGYFVLDSFKQIDQIQQAYYLSRFSFGTGLQTAEGASLDLQQLLANAPRRPFELAVRLGTRQQHQFPARLICLPLKQEVADQRRQKARDKARRRGKPISKAYLEFLGWAIFITNVPPAMLSWEQVTLLYRVRWQIELVFKLWKSYGGLKHIQPLRQERVLFELYAKMIGLVLTQFLVAPLQRMVDPASNQEISPFKVRQIFSRCARDLNRTLHALPDFLAVLADLVADIERFGFKQKRRNRSTICQVLALVSAVFVFDCSFQLEPDLPPLLP
jgi:hypothetical protein